MFSSQVNLEEIQSEYDDPPVFAQTSDVSNPLVFSTGILYGEPELTPFTSVIPLSVVTNPHSAS